MCPNRFPKWSSVSKWRNDFQFIINDVGALPRRVFGWRNQSWRHALPFPLHDPAEAGGTISSPFFFFLPSRLLCRSSSKPLVYPYDRGEYVSD